MNHQGNVPCLTSTQQKYIRDALALRRRLTYKAIAARLGVSERTVYIYGSGRRAGREHG